MPASRSFYVRFGSGNAASYTGLSPTFLKFYSNALAGLTTGPTIVEAFTLTGIYTFALTNPVNDSFAFTIDGATTGLSNSDRYVFGSIDGNDFVDHWAETLTAIGTTSLARESLLIGYGITLNAQSTTLTAIGLTTAGYIGTTASPFGDSATDPSTLFGYMKRAQENLEGDSNYVKGTGVWTVKDRAGLTTIATKTITDSGTTVTKT